MTPLPTSDAIGVSEFKLFNTRGMCTNRFLAGTHMKGILFRISLVGFLPVSILCLWELTQGDSPAEMVLAVGFLLGVLISLGWASYNVIRLARRSVSLAEPNDSHIQHTDVNRLPSTETPPMLYFRTSTRSTSGASCTSNSARQPTTSLYLSFCTRCLRPCSSPSAKAPVSRKLLL